MENRFGAQEIATVPSPRYEAILDRLKSIASELTGIDEQYVSTDVHFFQAGIDSLLLLQAIQSVEKRLGVRVSLVELLEDITTLDALAQHLDGLIPADVVLNGAHAAAPQPAAAVEAPQAIAAPAPVHAPAAAPVSAPAPAYPTPPAAAQPIAAPAANQSAVERVIAQQLQVMQQQIAALRGAALPAAPAPAAAPVQPAVESAAPAPAPAAPVVVPAAVPQSPRARIQPETFVAHQPMNNEAPGGMTPQQKAYVDSFIARYTERTKASKAHQVKYHLPLADSRVTARFRRALKEISYPIVGDRARGSRVWDADGNEYVDVGMAYGCSLFGHGPDFVSRAIQEQVERGYGVGPQSPLAGRAAELVCELGGVERAVFCNSGTEAVMGAIRAARTYTGRSKVAYFAGAYHGWSDVVQGRALGSGDRREVRPTAPGISSLPMGEVLILDWDQPSALETLAKHLDEIALVLVEPVQSRRPDIQPRAFLQELRRITREAGTLLLFDELITGFRIGAGGAQAFFGVDADLVTYGKIVAGGLPMGVVAGTREVMSVFDGGLWSYGDDSYPTGQRTLFAGAFFKHPLSMGVAVAILEEIRRRGPEMYEALNARASRLVERLNAFFEAERYPITAVNYGSVWRFFLGSEIKFPELLNYHLVDAGVHVLVETGTNFLSTAHTDEDLDTVFHGVRAAVEAMRRGGLIPPPPDSDGGGAPRPGTETASPAPAASAAGAPGVVEADAAQAPASGPRVLPLTEGQRQLWLESQLGDEAGLAYIEACSLRLHGPLDVDAFRRSVQVLVDRHETLRATFAPDGDVQVIHPRVLLDVPLEDLRHVAPADREAAVDAWTRRTVRRAFDLVNGPLVRIGLATLAEDEYVLAVAVHHGILDGWSFGVVMRELAAVYVAIRDGRAAELPPRPAHAQLVRAQVDAQREDEAAEAFWVEQFAGGVPVLELPTDRPRPALRSYAGERLTRVMQADLMPRVARMGKQHGFTMFNTLFSAFYVWLARVTGQDDIVIGTPSAGQAARTGVSELVGYSINILPIRARVDASATFLEHARLVRRTMLHALDHQNFSFPRLVEKVLRTRDPSRAPVFSVLMNLDRVSDEARFGDLPAHIANEFGGGAKVDLIFAFAEKGSELHLTCDYSTALFDRETIEHWLLSFERMLEHLARDGEVRLSELALVGPAERAQVVEAWNRTEREYPHVCIHELFETQVRATPDAVAVVFGDERMTYGELDAAANRLAHHLRARGIGPEDRVALCLERGPELLPAFFGILKAGAAYVPLDPTHPADRLAYMLEDSGARLLLSQSWLEARLPAARPEALFLDALGDEIDSMPTDRPESGVTPENLAYVYYTSGSTGRPKGVAMHHYGPSNYFAWGREAYRADEGHGAPVFSSMAVDLTLANFIPLFTGERVELLPEGPGVEALADAIRRTPGFSMIKITPTHLSLLNAELSPADAAASAGTLVIGADNLMAEPTLFWQRHAPGVRLLNEYGPTETVVGCSLFELEHGSRAEGRIPIGRPIDNLTMYVLDAHLQPLPVGVPGELYIGGVGVARGYLGRPSLTAEKFVPDPFAAAPGARFYRTGDRARFLADGNIEFLGRVDFQVKIRGYRIETGEIESVLSADAAVREAMVVVREDEPGDRRLVAYVVPAEGESPTADTLRAALRERVPEYMVPVAFVFLPDGFPVGSTGKIERKALPAPEYASAAERYVAPATPAEEAMAAIWAEVLRVERVGTTDNFFELGGHSLLATRVVSRAREVLAVELPLRAVFEGPTVGQLARRVDALRGADEAEPRAIARAPRDRPLPVSFGQHRMWFMHQMDPANGAYNVPVALRLPGELDADALERALAELVNRHEVLRTTYAAADDGTPVQVVGPAAFALERVSLDALEPAEREARVRAMAREAAARPFDLAAGPVVRGTLVRLDEADHVLFFTLHHVATDGWSMDVLAGEAVALYRAFAAGQPSPLAPLAVQYADYAAWEREWLQGDVLDRELDYWKTQLAGSPELLELPTDRPRPPVPTHRGGVVRLELPPELMGALQALAQGEGATLFMVLLAAWQALLGRYSGQQDVVVGTTIANRTRREVEGLVGLFMNVLALRGDLSGDPAFRALLARVRQTTLDGYEHQAVPFGKVVEVVRPERSRSHEPLFQVLFELEHGARALAPAPSSDGAPSEGAGAATAKYDLTLTLRGNHAGMGGVLQYTTDLFDAATAVRMADHYRMLLEQVARDGDVRLSALTLVGETERAQVVEAWNRTEREYPHVCIHELFETQVRATPDAVAVVFGEARMTYGELDAAANRLAHFLRARGIGPEDRVALCLDRGPELMTAFFGILKAGAAYVPLDPTHPADRLAYMLEDSGARLLLSQSWLDERLPAARPEALFLDALGDEIDSMPADRPESGVTPENLAYVYYTSGSTGRPKGVAMHHYGPSNYFAWGREAYRADEGHGAPVFSSMAVDLTLANFIPLFTGERVELLPEGPGVEALADAIRRTPGFSMIKITPTHLSLLNQVLAPEDAAASTGTLVVGADNLMAEPTLFWQRHAPGVRLLNEYGPTETVVGCSLYEMEHGKHVEGRIPIGRPIDNLTMYVLDAHLRPLPVGVPGELYIGGVGVARGYLGRPALTAEKFVPDPFAAAPGARFYRTGDRARFLADGNIEFLGRVDFQVKIRGYRIETGEIENVLVAHAAVRDVMVVPREDEPGDRRLVAYVVPEAGQSPTVDELRAALRERLPEYMVPAAFVFLPDGFPVGSTGKVERKNLPAPAAQARQGDGDGYAAPSTPAERALAELWEEVLNVTPVGVDDDFFALGGHSMLAVRLISLVRRRLDADLPLSALFEHPTIRRLALVLDGDDAAPEWSPLVAIQPEGGRVPLFFVHPIGGQVLCYVDLARALGNDQPFYGLQAPDLTRVGDEEVTLEQMAAQYVQAIRAVRPHGPYLLGGWSFGGMVAFEMAQQLTRAGESVPVVLILDTASPQGARQLAVLEEPAVLAGLAQEEGLKAGREVVLTSAELRPLDRRARVERTLDALREAGLASADVDPEFVIRLLHGHRLRNEAMARYTPDVYPGQLVLFRPTEAMADPDAPADLSNPEEWRPYSTAPLRVETVPGHHATMGSGRQAALMAERVRAVVDDVLGS